MRRIAFAALFALVAAARPAGAALESPPWIAIEIPANPYASATRGAFLLVHTYLRGAPQAAPLSGQAVALVDGARRTVPLEFSPTAQPAVYALRKTWADGARWVLVISAHPGAPGDSVTALVSVLPSGAIGEVRVPTRRSGDWDLPAPVSDDDVNRMLR